VSHGLAFVHEIALSIEGTLNRTVFVTTPLLVLILTFRLTTSCIGLPKVTFLPITPRARIVPVKPVPWVANAGSAENIFGTA
jgi:hypothetical protein